MAERYSDQLQRELDRAIQREFRQDETYGIEPDMVHVKFHNGDWPDLALVRVGDKWRAFYSDHTRSIGLGNRSNLMTWGEWCDVLDRWDITYTHSLGVESFRVKRGGKQS